MLDNSVAYFKILSLKWIKNYSDFYLQKCHKLRICLLNIRPVSASSTNKNIYLCFYVVQSTRQKSKIQLFNELMIYSKNEIYEKI